MNAVGLAGEHTWMSQSCSLIARMSCHERTPAAELSFFERGLDGERLHTTAPAQCRRTSGHTEPIMSTRFCWRSSAALSCNPEVVLRAALSATLIKSKSGGVKSV